MSVVQTRTNWWLYFLHSQDAINCKVYDQINDRERGGKDMILNVHLIPGVLKNEGEKQNQHKHAFLGLRKCRFSLSWRFGVFLLVEVKTNFMKAILKKDFY